jgi:hypothetical protein
MSNFNATPVAGSSVEEVLVIQDLLTEEQRKGLLEAEREQIFQNTGEWVW